MTVAEFAFVSLTAIMVLCGYAVALLVVVWKVYILEMDRIVLRGGKPDEDGFLLRTLRTTDYAFASLFSWAAARTLPKVDFTTVPRYLTRRFRIVALLYLLAIGAAVGTLLVGGCCL